MIARLACWLGLHNREIVIAETGVIDLRRPIFEYECQRCKGRWRRIPGREWEPIR